MPRWAGVPGTVRSENHQPGVDTSEHIVEGAWDILLAELAASRPKLILDTAPGDHRYYGKYPVTKFPALESFLERHYRRAEVVRDRQGHAAIDVWVRQDGV